MEWSSFFANSCYECGNWGTGYPLQLCQGCRAVSFCTKNCKDQQSKHQELCRVLTEIRGTSPSIFLLDGNRDYNVKDWGTLKTNLMLIVQLKLGRKLNKQEEEVLKHPRRCISCLEIDPNKLADCKVCPSTSFCFKHMQTKEEHSERCRKLLECAASDVFFAPILKRDLPIAPHDNQIPIKLPENMSAFIDNCGPPILPFPYNVQRSANSEIFSRPLTLLYAIEKLNYCVKDQLIVHVIGANAVELVDPSAFEVIFYYWPNLKELQLVFIGPDLPKSYFMPKQEWNERQRAKIKFNVKIEPTYYHDFIKTLDDTNHADFIIGYNLGVHEYFNVGSINDSWASTIKLIAQGKAPFLVTAYTYDEAQKDHERILSYSKKFITIFQDKNPFASQRHYRDFETEDFYYQNQFLNIYKIDALGCEIEALQALNLTDEGMICD